MEAGIYARISLDRDDTQVGVQRQIEDGHKEAQRRGWNVAEVYVDNSISASRGTVRPAYERMLTDIRNGRISAFVVWDLDRLTRTPRELEDIIDIAERHGVQLANIGGDIDLSTPQGMMTARIKGSVARHESDQLARRIRRSVEQRAATGRPHGQIPYGFHREDFIDADGKKSRRDVPHPEHGPIVVEAVERLLTGESVRGIVQSLNERGIAGPKSPKWTTQALKQVVKRPAIAGLSVLRGEVIGKSNGVPLIDEGTHHRITALFADPSRNLGGGGAPARYLVSGIARCGLCGEIVRRIKGRLDPARNKRMPDGYVCKGCTRVRRKQSLVDDVVTGAVIARLQRPDLLQALMAGRPDELNKAKDEQSQLEARMALAADQFAEGTITGEQLARINARLRPRLTELEQTIATAQPADGIGLLAGADAAERWKAAPLDIKRNVIDMLMKITIMPTGSGRGDNPESIVIEWKGSEDD